MARRSLIAAALSSCLLVAGAAAAEEVPDELALKLMLRVLTYDANFDRRGTGDFVVQVAFEKGHEARAARLVELAARLGLTTIARRPLKLVAAPLEGLDVSKSGAVLVAPGTSAAVAHDVVKAATGGKLYTMAFDEAVVKDGAMIGVASNDGRPQVLLNVVTARAIGADLNSAVLKVARTFQ
jgi:hypothetical protein